MNNSEHKRWLCRGALWLCLLLLSVHLINWILQPKYYYGNSGWPTTSSYNQFYRMRRNSIDVLFLGSSVAANAFSPQELYEQYGIRSYNLSSEQQSIFLSYWWLREALRRQSPKVVIVDLRFCVDYYGFDTINTTEGLTRKALDDMHFSRIKAKAVRALCDIDPSVDALSYIFTNIRFHDRWKSLGRYDFEIRSAFSAPLKGYSPATGGNPDLFHTFDPVDKAPEWPGMHPISMEYLEKMAQLCSEEGIALILVNLPDNKMFDAINNVYERFAGDYGLPYYNFAETSLYNEVGPNMPEENILGHMNLRGAMKITNFLGKILREEYQIPAVEDEQYEASREYYRQIIADDDLPKVTDPVQYLQKLMNQNYSIFIAVRDDASLSMSSDIRRELQTLGLACTWDESMYRQGYAAAITEDGIQEVWGEGAVLEGIFENSAETYRIESCGFDTGDRCSIEISGQERAVNSRGLNIVVYDRMTGLVVDSVCFDTSMGDPPVRPE